MGYEQDYADATLDSDGTDAKKGMSAGLILLLVFGGLCVVLSGISIVAAIAVPNLISARTAGNEATAIGAMRTLATAQTIYREADKDGNGIFDYASSLNALGKSTLIDSFLASGRKQGYSFTLGVGKDPTLLWWAKAEPINPGQTGNRYFYTDQSGLISWGLSDFDVDPTGASPPGLAPLGKPLSTTAAPPTSPR